MKKLLIIFCLTICSSYLFAQDDSSEIKNVMNKQIDAWNNGDINTFMQTYWKSDSVMFVSSPPTYGWQKTLENYKKHYPDTAKMGKLSYNIIKLNQLSLEYYFMVGEWHLKRSVGDIGGYFTLLFRKIKGNWVIVVDHTS